MSSVGKGGKHALAERRGFYLAESLSGKINLLVSCKFLGARSAAVEKTLWHFDVLFDNKSKASFFWVSGFENSNMN